MDFDLFNEEVELEIVELTDRKNELLNELEWEGCSPEREAEIQDELEMLYTKLDDLLAD